MSKFEKPPVSPGNQSEALRVGQFSLTSAEEAQIRKRAEQRGEDPKVAVEAARGKMSAANRELQANRAIKETERGMEELAKASPQELERLKRELESL